MQISSSSNLTFIFLDVVIDMDRHNIDKVLFDPLGVFLARCKSTKTFSSESFERCSRRFGRSYPFYQENDQEIGRPRTGFFGGQATCHSTNGGTE